MGCGPVVYLHSLALAQAAAGDTSIIACASDRAVTGAPAYTTVCEVIAGVSYVHIQNRPVHMHDFWDPDRECEDARCSEAFGRVVRDVCPDVVHIHNLIGLSFDVIREAKAHGSRVVMSLHNYFPLCSRDDLFFANAERCEGPSVRSCSNCLGTLAGDHHYRKRHEHAINVLNSCDALLAVSQRVADIYAEHGVRRDLLSVEHIASVAAEDLWQRVGEARTSQAVRTSGAPQAAQIDGAKQLHTVFYGSLTPRKGVFAFLQAIRALSHPERVQAHVYGGLSQQVADAIKVMLAKFPPSTAACLHFHGAFSQSDLLDILGPADLAVLPPRWEDNGPQTVLEALAAGVPVLATRIGGIPDFVVHGVNGLLVEDGCPDEIAALVDELSTRPQLLEQLRSGITPPLSMDDHRRALTRHYDRNSLH